MPRVHTAARTSPDAVEHGGRAICGYILEDTNTRAGSLTEVLPFMYTSLLKNEDDYS